MSVAGGLPRAVERGVVHGCEAMQIFAKNASQWRGRLIPPDEIRAFRRLVKRTGIAPVVSHASYLINLATADRALRTQSIAAMGDEIDRAESLGLFGVVLHPGCYTNGCEAHGLALIAEALDLLLRERRRGRTMVILEHTAGQGTSLGATFEQLATISSTDGYARTFEDFGRIVGFVRLKVVHMNDSKRPLGSHVDRHTHIGEGWIGLEAFGRIVNDRRFQGLPMLLETPKSESRATGPIVADPLDVKNLNILRGLISAR